MPSTAKRKAPKKAFDENPPWTAADFKRARPMSEMPELAAAFKRARGRPKAETTKEAISLRVDANVVATFRATGPGWQGRMNEALAKAATKIKKEPAHA